MSHRGIETGLSTTRFNGLASPQYLYKSQKISIWVLNQHLDLAVLDLVFSIPRLFGILINSYCSSLQSRKNILKFLYFNLKINSTTKWRDKSSGYPAILVFFL